MEQEIIKMKSPQKEAIVNNVKGRLAGMKKQPRGAATIFKVPHTIREPRAGAYEPKFVGIGLFYHNLNLREGHPTMAAQKHKLQYLEDLLTRNPQCKLENYVEVIRVVEEKARSCYSENMATTISPEQLVEGMVLDACFIIELFLKMADKDRIPEADPVYGTTWLIEHIAYDLLLLENQLPFFVLEDVYKTFVVAGTNPSGQKLPNLAMNFFNMWLKRKDSSTIMEQANGGKKSETQEKLYLPTTDAVHHLLHLVHLQFVSLCPRKEDERSNYLCFPFYKYTTTDPTDVEKNSPDHQQVTIPTATQLHNAGVKLRKGTNSNFLAIKFINGRLEIPAFFLEDSSDSLIRNLIAFEQCCRQSNRYRYSFTIYAYFMDRLVNTQDDVQILSESGILEHALGSDEEAAGFFNELCHGIVISFGKTYLGVVCEQLNQYYKFRPHKWRARLMRDYFSNPWSILSLVAAITLLILTLIQTLYSVLSYKKS